MKSNKRKEKRQIERLLRISEELSVILEKQKRYKKRLDKQKIVELYNSVCSKLDASNTGIYKKTKQFLLRLSENYKVSLQ